MEEKEHSRRKSHAFVIFLLFSNLFFIYKYFFPGERPIRISPIDIPIVFRNEGGLLEVAGMIKQENFFKEDNLKWWFADWGTTLSQVRVEATYRYHVKLRKEWSVRINGSLCIVEAPEIEPTLPVAIDTEKTVHNTESGWARFNKEENLELLNKSISTKLAENASKPEYINLVRESARKTIEEFIASWLLKEYQWGNSEWYAIKVIFPDEKRGEYKVGVIETTSEIDGIKKIERIAVKSF